MKLLFLSLLALLSGSRAAHHMAGKPAVARFSMNGIRGRVVFERSAAAKEMHITSNLTGITDSDVMMEIRSFPLLPGQSASPCGSRLGKIFNPYRNTTALGSLSERLNFTVQSGTYDWHDMSSLKLVGKTGIVGRSLVLTKNNVAMACANIALVKNPKMHQCGTKSNENRHETLRATFRGRVSGTVMIRRLIGAPTNDTTLYSHLYYTDDTADSTSGHYFHIHVNSVDSADGGCTTQQVGSVVQMFGDTMSVGMSPDDEDGKQVMTVEDTKPFQTLTNKALAIHNNTNPAILIACANVYILSPRKFVAKLSNNKNVSVEQNSPVDSTSIETSAGDDVQSISIGKYPVAANSQGRCALADTGPEFNPFRKTSQGKGMTPDKYPTGDLTDKLAEADGMQLGKSKVCDDNLPLFGANGVGGRSVIVRYRDGRVMCANLSQATAAGQTMKKAKATFLDKQGGNVVGTVYLQQYKNADGSLGETTIDTSGLKNADGISTLNHNYHVHVMRKGFFQNVSACGQNYAGGHFNPANVAYSTATTSSYQKYCNSQNQLRCELGDTSAKSGKINLNNSRAHRQDSYLPLDGTNTVLGRSFVIHVKSGGADRYACANIIPATAQDIQIGFKKSKLSGQSFSKADFENQVSSVASSSGLTASVLYTSTNGEDTDSGCMYVSAAIDGKDADAVAQKLYSANLGAYTQDPTCISFAQSTGSGASSIAVSLLGFILSAALALCIQ